MFDRAFRDATNDYATRQPYYTAFKTARNQRAAANSEMRRLAFAIRQADDAAGDPMMVFNNEHRASARDQANRFAQERDAVYWRLGPLRSAEVIARSNVCASYPGFVRKHPAVLAALATFPDAASAVETEIATRLAHLLDPVSPPVIIAPQEDLVCLSDITVRFHNGEMFKAFARAWIRAASLGEHLHPLVSQGAVRRVKPGEVHPSLRVAPPDPNAGGFNVQRHSTVPPWLASTPTPAVSADTMLQVIGDSFGFHDPIAGQTRRFHCGEVFKAYDVAFDLSREIAAGGLRVVA